MQLRSMQLVLADVRGGVGAGWAGAERGASKGYVATCCMLASKKTDPRLRGMYEPPDGRGARGVRGGRLVARSDLTSCSKAELAPCRGRSSWE